MPPRKTRSSSTEVEATVHKNARRKNIPTPELDRFLDKEARKPITLRYPRDPSLDPQLVWKGKDDQDGADLEVQARPIYIQEKIDPRVIIANLRDEQRTKQSQAELFADFNGITFEEQVNFYQHLQNWQNRLILGDSLQVMASLAEKEGLKGQVQCIYMDPPYGIKFGSNWQASTGSRRVTDGKVEDATRQPEQIKAFRDTWELGIHSYLSYLRDRLVLARELLTESGSLFLQIGDENVHLVRSVASEVFGTDNFVAEIVFAKTTGTSSNVLPEVFDLILWFAKDRQFLKFHPLFRRMDLSAALSGEFHQLELRDGTVRRATPEEVSNPKLLPTGARPVRTNTAVSPEASRNLTVTIDFGGVKKHPGADRHWKTSVEGMLRLWKMGRLDLSKSPTRMFRRFLDDFPLVELNNIWLDTRSEQNQEYVVQTSVEVVRRCILMSTDPGDLVLDPTCGGGTTAYMAEQWGRRWITIDTSRVAATLTRQRLMSAKYPYYVLADSTEGERLGAKVVDGAPPHGDIRKGFAYRKVPHVTLKSIANNPDIAAGMAPDAMEAAIAKHADTEVLYDQPYEDGKVVRVSGPFTVESLSPYRAVGPDTSHSTPTELSSDGKFEQTILENLRAAGVQNNKKGERIAFRTLEPWAGEYVHAVGEFDDVSRVKRVAVCIGPEYGTVGEPLVREAAKEAAGDFDILVICGYAFEAAVGEDVKRYGALTVLKASINPDLQFGGEILKKRSTDNLFTVFGEPDVAVNLGDDGVVVEVKGLDVYDPGTGDVRTSSPDDIACWFIDTNYNAEAFFVRHAYFTGDRATDPYEQLRKALRAEISDEAWESLYRTTSRPFPKPETGKIAVKVISHYGDEVMKVYDVR